MANRSRFPRMQKRRPYSPGDRRLHAELLEDRRMLALAAADDVFNTTEDSTENFFDVLGNDGDEPERLEIVEVGLPDRNGSVTIDQGRRLLYVPAPDVFGLDQFTYIVTDGVSSQTANVRVSITPINDAPVLSSQPGPHQIRRQIAVDSEDLWYGSTVADAGDVNGDGYSDVIVGGRTARVISGFDLSELHRFTDLRALQRGVAVGGAGDVNGDGLSDLIIGDRNDDQHGTKAGAVQIRSGADGTVLFAFYGESGDELGSAVSGAGDVNADGFADVAIAASKARHKLGRVDIISGKDGSILHSILPQNNQRKIFPQSEISVAAAGDLNQDGHDDVIVGLTMGGQRFTNFGDAAVISGADGSMLLDLMGRHHSFGHSVAAVGDVNADGINDVAIGSPGVSRGAGSAFVFSGLDGTMLHRWDGRPQGDNVGYSVSGAGDVNRDGYADVLIAVPGDNAVRLYSGLDGSRLDVLSFPPTDTSAVQFATDVSDTNGDGFSELAIGDSGLVWIVAQSHVLPTDEDTPTGDIPVSSMVGTARSDIDSDVSQMGVAVRKTSGKGTWQFRRVTDEDYRDVGPVSMAESLLLNDVDFIRYVPDQENAEWATLDVVAWDGSQGVSGDRFDTSQSGGTTAFSDASVIVTLAVQGINDHPSATNLDQQHSFSVGQTTVALDDIRISDPDIDEQITATLRLNTPHVGRLTTEGFRGEVFDAETGVWTIRGTVQNVNAALADVRYLPTLRTSQKIDVTIVDGGEDGAAALAGEVQLNADVPDLTVVTQPRLERHWIIAGDATDDSFGYSVHVAGDVNGDGFGDIIIGVPGDDTKANDAGSARVVSGLDFSDIYTFHGALPGAQFGFAVAGVDDVNADGVPDLLVGAPGDSRVGFRTGSVTMYSGADGQPLYELFGDRDSQQEFGRLVIDLGDVDGDGFGDFAIGAQDGGVHPGKGATLIVYSGYRVLPIFGRDGSCATSGRVIAAAGDVSADGVNDLLIGGCGARHQPFDTVLSGADGSFVFEFLGPHESLSGAGDINADGFDDVVAAIEGEVKIYSGESHSLLYTLDGVLEGSVQPVVSGAGDMDNDGFDDIIVATPSSPEAGRVQVFSGANRRPLYTFAGDSAQDQFGFSLGAGDINGDGLPDLVVGAPGDGKGAVDSGSVWVLRSSPTHFLLSGEIDGGAANGTPIVDLFGGFLTERERVHGAAVHSVTGAGLWQFSLDGGQTFDAVGPLDRSASLLLRPSDRIRYIGQPDDSSNATMEFILWNQTMGSAGERIDQLATETRSALLMRSAVATWPGADHPFEFSASHLSQEHTYVEDDPFVPLDRIQIVATDVEGELVASLTLRDSETGSLAPIDRATYDHETGNWTTTGTVAQVDAALAELSFVPERNNDLDTVVGIAISPVNHPAEQVLIGEIKLTVTRVNDAPTMHGRLQGIDVDDGDSKVAYAGDVDGDGLDDLLVGNGQALSVLSGLTFAKILTVRGGQSMTGVGDVNRDGMGDVLVGDGTQAFVYSGADGSTVLHLQGSSSRDDFGQSVGRIGDLNEDDVPDILIGAPQRTSAHEFRFGRGYVMVFSGADGTPIHTLLGESRSSGLGWSVNSAGDVDGDGIEDIVAGAVGDENTLVFSGRDGSVLHRVPSASYSVGGAGDVNGDGHADFLATSIGQVTTSGIQRGAVQVFSGKDGSIIAEFPEPSLLASFGASTAGLGDVDGDGLHDVVVGAPHEENENGASAGAAFRPLVSCSTHLEARMDVIDLVIPSPIWET